MRRRIFVLTTVGLAFCPELLAHAQRVGLRHVGWLGANSPAAADHPLAAFVAQLNELGWMMGRNLRIDVRWAEGQTAKLRELAAALEAAGAEVIVTSGDVAGLAVRSAGPMAQVVLASSANPVAAGLVQSLGRPGGSVTGLTASRADTAGRRLQLLKDIAPRTRKVAVVFNPDYPDARQNLRGLAQGLGPLGLALVRVDARGAGDVPQANAAAAAAGADAIFLTNDSVLAGTPVVRLHFIEAAASRRLPLVSSQYAVAADGGLLSMGTDIGAQGRRAAWQVHRILGGAKPGDLAVERPSTFKLTINLKTARALALTVPHSRLLRADEVIQ